MDKLSTGKVMTTKEVAEALGVSTDTVKNCIRRIMPNKMQNGKTTFLNAQEVAMISKELKGNTYVEKQLTYEAGSQVKNATTELEVLANAASALQALQGLLAQKEAELSQKQERIGELEHQVEYNKVIDCARWTDVKKEYHLTKLNKTKVKALLKEGVEWFEKCMGKDNYPTLLIKPTAVTKLVQIYSSL